MRLILAGDAMLGRGVDERLRRVGPETGLAALGQLFARGDVAFANLECAVAGADARYQGAPKAFLFRAAPATLQTLTSVGVALVSLANNHALDAGVDGLRQTLRHLAAAGIAAVGAGEDVQGAWAPGMLERAGTRLGVLAACDHQADFAAGRGRPGVAYLDRDDPGARDRLLDAVARLAPRVDHVVVSLHWQPNWVPRVAGDTRALAHALVAAGARVVWGHSPHHLQGVEWTRGSAVFYGTGSLIDDYALDPGFRNDRQLLYEVELAAGEVRSVRAHPIELRYAHTVPAAGEARAWIAARFAAACAALGSRVDDEGDGLRVVSGSEG
ncbi:MAG: CapA family protein, partial [Deinococcales bacterium]